MTLVWQVEHCARLRLARPSLWSQVTPRVGCDGSLLGVGGAALSFSPMQLPFRTCESSAWPAGVSGAKGHGQQTKWPLFWAHTGRERESAARLLGFGFEFELESAQSELGSGKGGLVAASGGQQAGAAGNSLNWLQLSGGANGCYVASRLL